MRSRRFALLLVLSVSSLLTVSSAVSINASADSLTKVPAASVQSFYGSSFPATYTIDNNTYSTTFHYFNTLSDLECDGVEIDSNSVASTVLQFRNYDLVIYAADVSSSQGRIDFMNVSDIETYFSDTVRGGVFVSCYLDRIFSNDNSIVSYPNNYFGSFQAICGNTQASASLVDYYGYCDITVYSGWSTMDFRFIPFYSDDTSLYLDSMEFQNLLTYMPSGVRTVYLGFLTPYIGGSMTGSPPISTTTTIDTSSGGAVTTGDINVNVDVDIDMDETNGLLSDIIDTLIDLGADIVSGVGDLFLPDDDYIENWVDDMSDLVVDAFSDNVHEDTLKDILLDIGTYGATDSIRFPAVTVGDVTIIPSTSVPLVPFGRDIMVHVETAVNLVCTIWVLNMVMNRIKGIIVGEKVVDIEGDDVE